MQRLSGYDCDSLVCRNVHSILSRRVIPEIAGNFLHSISVILVSVKEQNNGWDSNNVLFGFREILLFQHPVFVLRPVNLCRKKWCTISIHHCSVLGRASTLSTFSTSTEYSNFNSVVVANHYVLRTCTKFRCPKFHIMERVQLLPNKDPAIHCSRHIKNTESHESQTR